MRYRAFTFLVKFGLVLIYVLKVRKNKFNSLLTFFFENYVPFQVLKDFSVENFKTTPSTFFLNFFSEIYLSRIINYCCSIFTLYLTLKAFSLVCLLSAFFLVFLFLLIYIYFFDRHQRSTGQHRMESESLFFLFSTSTRSRVCI